MTAEAAFLDALRANPADDTARLVYADWLDDHGEHEKAAYLRAVVDLTVLPPGSPEYSDAAGRLYVAVLKTEVGWRQDAGGRFDLFLAGYDSGRKVETIVAVRGFTGWGLAEAKAMAESAPTPLYSWRPFETLLPLLLRFEVVPGGRGRFGALATIRPTPWPGGPPGTVYDVVLTSREPGYSPRLVDAVAVALGVTGPEAVERLQSLPLTLASGLGVIALAEFLRSLHMRCHPAEPLPPDSLQVVPRLPA